MKLPCATPNHPCVRSAVHPPPGQRCNLFGESMHKQKEHLRDIPPCGCFLVSAFIPCFTTAVHAVFAARRSIRPVLFAIGGKDLSEIDRMGIAVRRRLIVSIITSAIVGIHMLEFAFRFEHDAALKLQ